MTRIPASIYFAVALGCLLIALWTGLTGLEITEGPRAAWTVWSVIFLLAAIIIGLFALFVRTNTRVVKTDPLTRLTPSKPPRGGYSDHLRRPSNNNLTGASAIPRRSAGRSIVEGGR